LAKLRVLSGEDAATFFFNPSRSRIESKVMSRVEQLERAIEELSPEEFGEIARRVNAIEQKRWDEQLDRDGAAGKLDFLIADAKSERTSRAARKRISLDAESQQMLCDIAEAYGGDVNRALTDLIRAHESVETFVEQCEDAQRNTLNEQADRAEKGFREGRFTTWDEVKRRNGL
jgi:hypothetical protein